VVGGSYCTRLEKRVGVLLPASYDTRGRRIEQGVVADVGGEEEKS